MDPNNLDPRYTEHDNSPDVDGGGSSVVAGSFWMIAITLLLFFLPAINGLIGGLVGGYKVGSVGRALTAAILPAVVATAGLWGILAYMDKPVLGFLAGATIGFLVLLSDLGIFIGAAIGGALAPRTRLRF